MDNIQQWEYEYDVYYITSGDFSGWLKGYGEQGWELISTHFNTSNQSYHDEYYRCIFKRPKLNTNGEDS